MKSPYIPYMFNKLANSDSYYYDEMTFDRMPNIVKHVPPIIIIQLHK